MQYKVPQNIDIEDKVIAGLTLRQFMFLLVAGGAGLVEFYFFTGPLSFLFFPVVLATAAVGIAFAFAKVNDRPFEIFIVSAAKTIFAPRVRVWNKDDDPEIPKQDQPKAAKPSSKKKSLKEVKSGLEKLATIVDSGGAAVAEDEEPEDRVTNIKPTVASEPSGIKDILAKTEEEAPAVDKYLDQAKTFVEKNKKEQTVGEMAKVKTAKEDFDYEKLKLADEKKLEAALEEIEEHQKEREEEISSAKVQRHPDLPTE